MGSAKAGSDAGGDTGGDSPRSGDQPDKDSERKKQELLAKGKAQGFLTYDEVNELMPAGVTSPAKMDAWLSLLSNAGIEIVDAAPKGKPAASAAALAEEEDEQEEADAEGDETPAAASDKEDADEDGGGGAKRPPTTRRRGSIRFACTCARWVRSRCSPVRARSRSPSRWRRGGGGFCKSS